VTTTTEAGDHRDARQVATELAACFADAWNRHDMDDLVSLFDEDASFVNVVGMHMHGRDEIRQAHATVHAGTYRNSRIVVEVEDARELAPDVIVAHAHTELEGDERLPGEVRRSLLTLVIHRGKEGWGVAAAQNTFLATPYLGR